MIIDSIQNMPRYFSRVRELEDVYSLICSQKINNLPLGKLTINPRVYLNKEEYFGVQPYEKQFEVHQEHIDVQIVINGIEEIDVLFNDGFCKEIKEKQSENDISFVDYSGGDVSRFILKNSLFIIIFPYELHKPCISINNELITKVVFKIKVGEDIL